MLVFEEKTPTPGAAGVGANRTTAVSPDSNGNVIDSLPDYARRVYNRVDGYCRDVDDIDARMSVAGGVGVGDEKKKNSDDERFATARLDFSYHAAGALRNCIKKVFRPDPTRPPVTPRQLLQSTHNCTAISVYAVRKSPAGKLANFPSLAGAHCLPAEIIAGAIYATIGDAIALIDVAENGVAADAPIAVRMDSWWLDSVRPGLVTDDNEGLWLDSVASAGDDPDASSVISELVLLICPGLADQPRKLKAVLASLRSFADLRPITYNDDLVLFSNCVYRLSTKESIYYNDPSLSDCTFTSKLAIPLIDPNTPEPVHVRPDGSTITAREVIASFATGPAIIPTTPESGPLMTPNDALAVIEGLSPMPAPEPEPEPDPDPTPFLHETLHNNLWQVIRHAEQPWRQDRMMYLYDQHGNGGKSTFVSIPTAIIGAGRVDRQQISDLEGRFSLMHATRTSAFISTDNDARSFTKNVINIKTLVTQDPTRYELKGGRVSTFAPHAMMLACINALPGFGDTTDALYRRFLFEPMPNNFNGSEDKTIKTEFLRDPRVVAWIARYALDNYEWSEYQDSEDSAALKAEARKASSPVEAFAAAYLDPESDEWSERTDKLDLACATSTGLPFNTAVTGQAFYAAFERYYKSTHAGGTFKMPSYNAFFKDFSTAASRYGWSYRAQYECGTLDRPLADKSDGGCSIVDLERGAHPGIVLQAAGQRRRRRVFKYTGDEPVITIDDECVPRGFGKYIGLRNPALRSSTNLTLVPSTATAEGM